MSQTGLLSLPDAPGWHQDLFFFFFSIHETETVTWFRKYHQRRDPQSGEYGEMSFLGELSL